MNLAEYVKQEATGERAIVTLEVEGLPPDVLANLRRMDRLGVLSDETVLCLIGQAPVDPCGFYAALKPHSHWAFQPLDFTALCVLAKDGDIPIALMRIDLMSDDITFVVRRNKQLVQHSVILADDIMTQLAGVESREATFMHLISGKAAEVVDEACRQ